MKRKYPTEWAEFRTSNSYGSYRIHTRRISRAFTEYAVADARQPGNPPLYRAGSLMPVEAKARELAIEQRSAEYRAATASK